MPSYWAGWIDVFKALGIWIISVLLLLVIPVITALPHMIYQVVKFGPVALQPNAIKGDKLLLFYSVLGILPAHLLTLLVVWLLLTRGGRRHSFWSSVGWEWPDGISAKKVAWVSALVAVGLYAVAWGVTTLYHGEKTDLDILIESSVYTRITTAIIAFTTAPLVEELIYRGVIYPAVEKVTGMWFAVAVVTLLFAGVHVWQYRTNVAVIVVITLLSLTVTVARAVSRKLIPSYIIHLVFNGVQSVLLILGSFIDKDFLK